MWNKRLCVFVALVLVWGGLNGLRAQENADSLITYDLSEIVIGGEARHADASQRLYRIGLSELSRHDKPDIAGVLRMLPSTHLQTNSRGESLVYVRGAGERQVAIFLDGAPLNIGWDNRVDLSMIPANVLGSITLERGAVSSAYGPNAVGGAVNLNSRSLSGNNAIRELTLQAGTPLSRQVKGLLATKKNQLSLLAGGTILHSDGISVSKDADLPFSQQGTLRTNSDKSTATVYGRVDYQRELGSVGLTVFHVSSEKGVSPESHLDPAVESIRYWRYPVWKNTMAIVNGVSRALPVHFFTTAWASRFQQQIDQYYSDSYRMRDFRQEDLDLSAGVRAVAEWKVGSISYRGIGFLSSTTHRQVDTDLTDTVQDESAEMEYSNVLYSAGVEVVVPNSMSGKWVFGVSLDGMNTPKTGDKPAQPSLHDWSVNLEADLALNQHMQWVFNAGSKSRFPTLRELYGVALNRFILNPDLKGERVWTAESGLKFQDALTALELNGFFQRTVDAIDQINLVVDGQRKRQRVNLDGSRVWGIELLGARQLGEQFRLDGNATWLRPIAFSGDSEHHLTEKPEMMVSINATYSVSNAVRFMVSGLHIGRAYGLMPDNTQVALPRSTELNVRVTTSHYFGGQGVFVEAFAGVDNVFDTLNLPQLGLPAAGRSGRIGLNLSY